MTFAQGEEPDALSKTIRYPVAEYLDVLAVTSRNQVFPGTKPTIGLRLWPFVPSMDEIFSWLGDYLITVVITGDGVMPPITALLKFNWTGNWETAALTLIQESTAQMSHIQELEHKPLKGIRLRNECDKWIESGKALRERLVMEGKAAIPEALCGLYKLCVWQLLSLYEFQRRIPKQKLVIPILFSDLNEAAALALRNSVQCANRQVYFAGDPESGGHAIGRRSIAPETVFRFRCRSWSSAR